MSGWIQLGVFAKYPAPGQVKTRLAKRLGAARAAEVASLFLLTSLRRLTGLADRHVLGFAPPAAAAPMAELLGPRLCEAWELRPQSDGDLGARMRHYFEQAFSAGAGRVLLLGADTPDVPLARIESAAEALLKSPLALGPSEDGGYYLIGASGRTPPVFDDVPWGGASVWSETVGRARRRRVTFQTLDPWRDVDRWEDLLALRASLDGAADPCLQALAVQLAQILPAAS